ncbi:metal-dependent hydrolase [Natronosalvus rutilus]|uniref:Metal-dependent hydrolase n=1 Tax=Natronosalvus rutilus TaxID=2953753 RepID=A0A9E7NB11_9EURY|nr:metal-dependent hydrolase [Natronosalvus rutilus]UTF54136.1 metal-dependent hydrolase [Natronosalvus rutilus]
MWPLGHAAVAYLLYSLWTRRQPARVPGAVAVVCGLVGSQFPDLIDKPLAWYAPVLPTGRSLAHSLLFLLPVSLVVLAVASRYERPTYAIVFAIGAFSHLLADTVPALWGAEEYGYLLWPIVPVEPEEGAPSILELFSSSLGDPYFLLEFVLAAAALVVWRADGYPGLDLVTDRLEPGSDEREHPSR